MQFNFSEDSNLYGRAPHDDKFEFPVNIKQMGSLEEKIKIYMEDYVYTYLFQYAKTNGNKEKLSVLVGKFIEKQEQKILVISGAIQGKYSLNEKGMEHFTQETWDYVNHQMDHYFSGLEIVGWMHTQPGYGTFLMARDEAYHKANFTSSYHVLYVLDPIERQDTFYIYNEEKTALKPAKGYIIYYDKNENMQDYMIENSISKPKITLDKAEEEEMAAAEMETEQQQPEGQEKEKKVKRQRLDAAPQIRSLLKRKAQEVEERARNRYTVLVGVCGVLCMVCFAMGISLIHNQSRINKLEEEVVSVMSIYQGIETRLDDTASVFAAQNMQIQQQQQQIAETAQKEAETSTAQAESPSTPEAPPQTSAEEQTEEIPASAAEPSQYYLVEKGDTLGYISMKFYGTESMIDEIMQANHMTDPDKIYYGKKLLLPNVSND